MRRISSLAVLLCFALPAWSEPLWTGVFENSQQSTAGIEAAVDTAVAKMNFVTRPIARGRLNKTNPAYRRVAIERDEQVVRVRFDERKPIEMPANGEPVAWTREDGEQFQVSARITDDALVQTFKADDGERVNTFTANAAGQMTMEAKISSPRLPTPVIYTLLYQRSAR